MFCLAWDKEKNPDVALTPRSQPSDMLERGQPCRTGVEGTLHLSPTPARGLPLLSLARAFSAPASPWLWFCVSWDKDSLGPLFRAAHPQQGWSGCKSHSPLRRSEPPGNPTQLTTLSCLTHTLCSSQMGLESASPQLGFCVPRRECSTDHEILGQT